MTSRTTVQTVRFPHPFTLRAMGAEQPAGTYVVETDEELVESLSFTAYRRTGTRIRLPGQSEGVGSVQVARIDPDELDDALGSAERANPCVPDSPNDPLSPNDPMTMDRLNNEPNTSSETMAMHPPSPVALPTLWTTMKGYFVPPLVVPIGFLLAVLAFALIHGPVT